MENKIICVTGSHSASSRFFAKFLAKRDNVLYIDEGEFNQRDYELLKIKIRKNVSDGCVIHAPGLKHKVREFKKDYPDSEVIWMYREPKECVASMKKLHNWEEYAKQELKNMKPILDEYEINSHAETFMKLVISTRTLGEVYFEQGYISQLVNMKAIEHYPGFKKTTIIK